MAGEFHVPLLLQLLLYCSFITLCASCSAVYCNRSCLCVGEWVGVCVRVRVGLLPQ